jgi:hypothetical protein
MNGILKKLTKEEKEYAINFLNTNGQKKKRLLLLEQQQQQAEEPTNKPKRAAITRDIDADESE